MSSASSSLSSSWFPPVQYLSLLEEKTTPTTTHLSSNSCHNDEDDDNNDDEANVTRRCGGSSNRPHHGGVVLDGVILTIQQPPPPPAEKTASAVSSERDGVVITTTGSGGYDPPPPHSPLPRYRILLQRKLRHTGTGGNIHVGFVLQGEDGHVVTTTNNEVQMVHVRMESTTTTGAVTVAASERGSTVVSANNHGDEKNRSSSSSSSFLWDTTIDPGFRALQWLHHQLLQLLPPPPPVPLPPPMLRMSHDDATPYNYYRLDLSAHLLLAKNEQHAVCVTPRRVNAVSLADFLVSSSSSSSFYAKQEQEEEVVVEEESHRNDHERCFVWTEDSVRRLFRDVLTGLKTLHGLGVCHRNINMDTILVVSSSSSLNTSNSHDVAAADDDDDTNNNSTDTATTTVLPSLYALVSGLESCRSIEEAQQCPSFNQTPQCVPPEVWKGTIIETMSSSSCSWLLQEELQHEPTAKQQHGCHHQHAYSPTNDDLWAAGVVLSVLLLKAPLFDTPLTMDMSYQSVLHAADEATVAGAPTDQGADATSTITTRFPLASNAALELMRAMLAEFPEDRLTLEQIWHHEWLRPLASSSEPSPSQ